MPENTSHPVKAEDITIAYPRGGKHDGIATIHRTGCAHAARRTWTSTYGPSQHVGTGFVPGGDDWFEVAPCARKA